MIHLVGGGGEVPAAARSTPRVEAGPYHLTVTRRWPRQTSTDVAAAILFLRVSSARVEALGCPF